MNQIIKNTVKILALMIVVIFVVLTVFSNKKAEASWTDSYTTSYTYWQSYTYYEQVYHACPWENLGPLYKCLINPEGQWCHPGGTFGYRDCSDNATCWGNSGTAYSALYRNSCTGGGWCDNIGNPPSQSYYSNEARTGYYLETAYNTTYTCHYVSSWSCSGSTPVANWSTIGGSSCSDASQPTCCSVSSWSPDPSTVCSGQPFTQTSNCGSTRSATGTKCCPTSWSPDPSTVCSGTPFTQTSNCGSTRSATGTQSCCTSTSWSPDPSTVCSDQTLTQTSNCGTTRTVSGTKNCPPSASTNLQQSSNYCSAELVHILSWKFNDTSGDIQSKYRVQVDNNSNFSSLEVDSGEISSASASYTAPKLSSFNTLYYWRVMTWDSASQASPWSATANFTTYKHAWPLVKFSWNPSSPLKNQSTDFTDATTVYGGATKQSFLWAFQDATFSSGYSSAIPNTRVKFTSKGSKNVTLQVTDSDTYNCAATKAVTVTSSWLFNWKEIAP